jgi:hypothetical protein
MDARQEPLQPLFAFSQCIVQEVAEVGLDDLQLAPRHWHRWGKIVDDIRAT